MIIVGTIQLNYPVLFNIQKTEILNHITFRTENRKVWLCTFGENGKEKEKVKI